MRILVLTCQDPGELANGIGSIAHNSMRCMTDLGHQVRTVCIIDEKLSAPPAPYAQGARHSLREIDVIRLTRKIDPRRDAFRTVTRGFLHPGENRFRDELRLRSRECDIAIWFGHLWDPLTGVVLRDSSCPVLLHVNDSISLVRKQRASGFAGKIQVRIAEFVESSIIRRLHPSRAGIVYVGEEDRQSALTMAASRNVPAVFCLPLAVDTDAFCPAPEAHSRDTPVILFTGHMGYGPNVLAAEHLVRRILPLLSGPISVRLAGKSPADAVLALAKLDKCVTVTGEIPDIVAEYQRADVFVAPISYSYGMKTKIVEAMACALPVVASPGAASGFPGVPPGVFVGRTDEEMASLTMKLLNDATLRRQSGEAARSYVLQHHRWLERTRKLTALVGPAANIDQ